MLQNLTKFHPGLVGAALGCSAGAFYSAGWFNLDSAGPGLNESETAWLLALTVALLYCLPLLTGYFAYYAYPGLRADSTRSVEKSWRTIVLIVLSLVFIYFLVLEILFTHPASISTQAVQIIFATYVVIVLVLLHLCYRLPWVNRGRLALKKCTLKAEADDREQTHPEAGSAGISARIWHQQDRAEKAEMK